MATLVNRSIRVKCESCGAIETVPLLLNADDQPVECSSCGEHICTMGELVDQVTKEVVRRLGAGLERRVAN